MTQRDPEVGNTEEIIGEANQTMVSGFDSTQQANTGKF